MVFVILFSLLAALLNAVSAIMQRRAAGEPTMEELFRKEFSKRVTLDRLWIFGFVLEVLAFFAQAAALKNGSLVVVEPLLTIDLVFLMLILYWRYHLNIGRLEWAATAMICSGLSLLLWVASPQTGHQPFMASRWLETALPILAVIIMAIYFVRRTRANDRRAAISGFGAGLSFALVAMMTKLTTEQLHAGIIAIMTGWQVYGLLAAGILSIIMEQNTFGAGPVTMSQPVMEVVEPLVSVFMGIMLFGDSIKLNISALILESCASALAVAGIWLLGRSNELSIEKI